MRSRSRVARVVVTVVALVVVSLAWVTVATGIRAVANAEVQRSADAAALAGAAALMQTPRDPAPAAAEAIRFARLNRVAGRAPLVGPEDVRIDVESGRVQVRVRATVYRIPNALAWVLGVEEVSVSAVATAEALAGYPLGPRPSLTRVLRLVE